MHFMLSREVVLGSRGKKYFKDKVKDFRAIKPLQLFNEAYGWYNEDGPLEEEEDAEEEEEGYTASLRRYRDSPVASAPQPTLCMPLIGCTEHSFNLD